MRELLRFKAGQSMEPHLKNQTRLGLPPSAVDSFVLLVLPGVLAIEPSEPGRIEPGAVGVDTRRVLPFGILERIPDRVLDHRERVANGEIGLLFERGGDLLREAFLAFQAVVEADQVAATTFGFDAEHGRGGHILLNLADSVAAAVDGLSAVFGVDLRLVLGERSAALGPGGVISGWRRDRTVRNIGAVGRRRPEAIRSERPRVLLAQTIDPQRHHLAKRPAHCW